MQSVTGAASVPPAIGDSAPVIGGDRRPATAVSGSPRKWAEGTDDYAREGVPFET